jgi:hypothetical protein
MNSKRNTKFVFALVCMVMVVCIVAAFFGRVQLVPSVSMSSDRVWAYPEGWETETPTITPTFTPTPSPTPTPTPAPLPQLGTINSEGERLVYVANLDNMGHYVAVFLSMVCGQYSNTMSILDNDDSWPSQYGGDGLQIQLHSGNGQGNPSDFLKQYGDIFLADWTWNWVGTQPNSHSTYWWNGVKAVDQPPDGQPTGWPGFSVGNEDLPHYWQFLWIKSTTSMGYWDYHSWYLEWPCDHRLWYPSILNQ